MYSSTINASTWLNCTNKGMGKRKSQRTVYGITPFVSNLKPLKPYHIMSMDTHISYGIVETCMGMMNTKFWMVITFEGGEREMGSKSCSSIYFIFVCLKTTTF